MALSHILCTAGGLTVGGVGGGLLGYHLGKKAAQTETNKAVDTAVAATANLMTRRANDNDVAGVAQLHKALTGREPATAAA